MRPSTRIGLLVVSMVVCVGLMLAFAVGAFAEVTGTWAAASITPAKDNLLSSDAIMPGNVWVWWTNQDVTLSDLQAFYTTQDENAPIPEDTAIDVATEYTTYTVNGSAPATYTAPLAFSREGTYTVVAGSVDGSGTQFETPVYTVFGDPVFGIDKTRPTAWTNAVPVYDGSATITVSAHDALSGLREVVVSLDGGPEWSSPGSMFGWALTVPLDVPAGVGSHVLKYFAIDYAGNVLPMQQVAFSVNPTVGFVPQLSNVKVKLAKKRKATFSGTVSAITSPATVKLTVDTKVGKKWKRGTANYFVTVPKYMSTYALTKTFKKAGTYRVTAHEGSGHSPKAVTFSVK